MKLPCLAVLALLLACPAEGQSGASAVVSEVRAALNARDLDRAEAIQAKHRQDRGDTPEVIEALSWLGRGALAERQLDRADRYARETLRIAVQALGDRALDDEPRLATAIGAAIETRAMVSAERGQRSDAVYFLQRQLEVYAHSPIHKRLQKNLHLLSLEGQQAPGLERSEFIGTQPPALESLRGRVVVLFFWAHWCPDCKIQGPILSELLDTYRAQGLAIVAPTQRFGYVSGGAPAAPDEEMRYIRQVRDTSYPFLADLPVPVSDANHTLYGVSSTPTIVLLDRQGVVRLYHPGRLTKEELEAHLRPLLASDSVAALPEDPRMPGGGR